MTLIWVCPRAMGAIAIPLQSVRRVTALKLHRVGALAAECTVMNGGGRRLGIHGHGGGEREQRA